MNTVAEPSKTDLKVPRLGATRTVRDSMLDCEETVKLNTEAMVASGQPTASIVMSAAANASHPSTSQYTTGHPIHTLPTFPHAQASTGSKGVADDEDQSPLGHILHTVKRAFALDLIPPVVRQRLAEQGNAPKSIVNDAQVASSSNQSAMHDKQHPLTAAEGRKEMEDMLKECEARRPPRPVIQIVLKPAATQDARARFSYKKPSSQVLGSWSHMAHLYLSPEHVPPPPPFTTLPKAVPWRSIQGHYSHGEESQPNHAGFQSQHQPQQQPQQQLPPWHVTHGPVQRQDSYGPYQTQQPVYHQQGYFAYYPMSHAACYPDPTAYYWHQGPASYAMGSQHAQKMGPQFYSTDPWSQTQQHYQQPWQRSYIAPTSHQSYRNGSGSAAPPSSQTLTNAGQFPRSAPLVNPEDMDWQTSVPTHSQTTTPAITYHAYLPSQPIAKSLPQARPSLALPTKPTVDPSTPRPAKPLSKAEQARALAVANKLIVPVKPEAQPGTPAVLATTAAKNLPSKPKLEKKTLAAPEPAASGSAVVQEEDAMDVDRQEPTLAKHKKRSHKEMTTAGPKDKQPNVEGNGSEPVSPPTKKMRTNKAEPVSPPTKKTCTKKTVTWAPELAVTTPKDNSSSPTSSMIFNVSAGKQIKRKRSQVTSSAKEVAPRELEEGEVDMTERVKKVKKRKATTASESGSSAHSSGKQLALKAKLIEVVTKVDDGEEEEGEIIISDPGVNGPLPDLPVPPTSWAAKARRVNRALASNMNPADVAKGAGLLLRLTLIKKTTKVPEETQQAYVGASESSPSLLGMTRSFSRQMAIINPTSTKPRVLRSLECTEGSKQASSTKQADKQVTSERSQGSKQVVSANQAGQPQVTVGAATAAPCTKGLTAAEVRRRRIKQERLRLKQVRDEAKSAAAAAAAIKTNGAITGAATVGAQATAASSTQSAAAPQGGTSAGKPPPQAPATTTSTKKKRLPKHQRRKNWLYQKSITPQLTEELVENILAIAIRQSKKKRTRNLLAVVPHLPDRVKMMAKGRTRFVDAVDATKRGGAFLHNLTMLKRSNDPDLTRKLEVMLYFASKRGKLDSLNWWRDWWLEDRVNRPMPHYDANAIMIAAKLGKVEVLEWWRRNQGAFPLKINYRAVAEASRQGHLHVLEWFFKHSRPSVPRSERVKMLYSAKAMDWASLEKRIDVLDWWLTKSKVEPKEDQLKLMYSPRAMGWASRKGHIEVLDWWVNSGLKLKYATSALKWATENVHLNVLNWWKEKWQSADFPQVSTLKYTYYTYAKAGTGRPGAREWWSENATWWPFPKCNRRRILRAPLRRKRRKKTRAISRSFRQIIAGLHPKYKFHNGRVSLKTDEERAQTAAARAAAAAAAAVAENGGAGTSVQVAQFSTVSSPAAAPAPAPASSASAASVPLGVFSLPVGGRLGPAEAAAVQVGRPLGLGPSTISSQAVAAATRLPEPLHDYDQQLMEPPPMLPSQVLDADANWVDDGPLSQNDFADMFLQSPTSFAAQEPMSLISDTNDSQTVMFGEPFLNPTHKSGVPPFSVGFWPSASVSIPTNAVEGSVLSSNIGATSFGPTTHHMLDNSSQQREFTNDLTTSWDSLSFFSDSSLGTHPNAFPDSLTLQQTNSVGVIPTHVPPSNSEHALGWSTLVDSSVTQQGTEHSTVFQERVIVPSTGSGPQTAATDSHGMIDLDALMQLALMPPNNQELPPC